ncbi:hypothetical protein JTE90_017189 [Oedothorax gibbosus]|uniref:HECT-type E3 ubiquitin transferase n=1 Tax=Oedothorax gibbosus TaxID=931172 RepID=A0AAV6V9L0_9ARAC|nr:hypothetical protein JTE90_017189 [Oedothorax gibbosus]
MPTIPEYVSFWHFIFGILERFFSKDRIIAPSPKTQHGGLLIACDGMLAERPLPPPLRLGPPSIPPPARTSSSPTSPVPPAPPTRRCSALHLSRTEHLLHSAEPLLLKWDIKEEPHASDWIGLYRTDETDPSRYLECKSRWPSVTPRGQILWTIENKDLFTDEVTHVCFKYYHGASGALRAVSPVVTVHRDSGTPQCVDEILVGHSSHPVEMVKFTLSNLCARGLRKGLFFSPDPYAKMQVQPGEGVLLPHHGQVCRTTTADATTTPNWPGQFEFIAYPSDVLEFEVKDKFAKSRPIISRFLGKFSIQISLLLDQCTGGVPVELSFGLCNKSPSDHVTGQIGFTFTLENGPVDPWTHIRQVHNPIYASEVVGAADAHISGPNTPQHVVLPPHTPSTQHNGCLSGNGSSSGGREQPPRRESEQRRSVRSGSDQSLNSIVVPPVRRASQVSVSRLSVPGGAPSAVAFTNMEYVMNPVVPPSEATPPPVEPSPAIPPPLPPKQKASKGHRPLERSKGHGGPSTSSEGANNSSSDSSQSSSRRGGKPEDSFLLEIVDTDERGAPTLPRGSPPPLPQRTSSGAARPRALAVQPPALYNNSSQSPQQAPLATPEHDSLAEGGMGGACSSLENLASEGGYSELEGGSAYCPSDLDHETYLSLSEASDLQHTCHHDLDQDEIPGAYSACVPSSPSSSQTLSASTTGEHNSDSEEAPHLRDTGGEEASPGSSLSLLSTPDSVATPVSPGLVVSPASDEPPSSPEEEPTHARITYARPTHDLWQQHRRNSLGCLATRSLSFSVGGSSTLQHLPTARLPSIPERTSRYQRVDIEDTLPPHWEARVDSHGRVFYIDHVNRTTTWTKPTSGTHLQITLGTASELQRQQLDRRYQSIRRTITSRPPQPEESPPPSSPPGAHPRHLLASLPAVRFLTRTDFLNMLHMNDEALVVYNRSSSLKHMITKIRRDPSGFERYQHNRDLVSLLNKFAETTRELPRGWETKLDRAGKQFFIDHTSRSTTFIDPRLPVEAPPLDPNKLPARQRRDEMRGDAASTTQQQQRQPEQAGSSSSVVASPPPPSSSQQQQGPVPPPRPPSSVGTSSVVPHVVPHVPTAYNDKVVAFLRQPNILDILRERHPPVQSNQSLRDKVAAVRADGTQAIDRFSHDIDLTILLSLFEQEIMSYIPAQFSSRSPRTSPQPSPQASPGLQRANVRAPAPYRRDFEAKLRNFYRKLESKGYGQGPGKMKLNIRRDHLLEDAFTKIMAASKKDLQKSRLYISFAGEEGLDYGGPSREFFFLLSRELFNPYYGLFEYSANDTYTVQVSPMSAFVDNLHEWFRFSGRVLGLALVHQYLLDAFFTRPFYKALLRLPCSLSDLEYLDAEFHQSLLWLKDNDISELGLELTFSVTEEVAGKVVERELRPGGRGTGVGERNKRDYIERMLKWRLERGVAEQTESLVKGFYEVVDPRLVSVFDARELELVIAGTAEIDISDWRKNTEYRSGYHDNHPVIVWFWLAIEKFDNERRLRLLQFVTGTSSVPYEGFSALRGSNGPRRFCIEKWGKPTSLPRAHTCFNRLDLPPYPTFEMLHEKLLLAVEESSTFGIE